MLQWVGRPSSRGSSQPRDQTCVSCISCIGRWVLYHQHHLGSPRTLIGALKSPPSGLDLPAGLHLHGSSPPCPRGNAEVCWSLNSSPELSSFSLDVPSWTPSGCPCCSNAPVSSAPPRLQSLLFRPHLLCCFLCDQPPISTGLSFNAAFSFLPATHLVQLFFLTSQDTGLHIVVLIFLLIGG